MLFSQVSDIDLFVLVRCSMEHLLLLVDVAEAPAKRKGKDNDAASESASDSATLGEERTVASFSKGTSSGNVDIRKANVRIFLWEHS